MNAVTLLPVTRAWSMTDVCNGLFVSDAPRDVVLVLDAPNCGAWRFMLEALGFTVHLTETGAPLPPDGVVARRPRHLAMRRLTQDLLSLWSADTRLLCIEDDSLIPPDAFSRLLAAGDNATGVQVERHSERRRPGVWGATAYEGVEDIRACGLYCLSTTVGAYRAAAVPDVTSVAIDAAQTSQIRPLVVDWSVRVGHLTPGGDILTWGGERR